MRALLLALLFLTALPAGAGASAVRVDFYTGPTDECSKYALCPPNTLEFVAGSAEGNDVTVTYTGTAPQGDSRYVVRDAGAPLQIGAGCESLDEHLAACHADTVGAVHLGDRDDRATSSGSVSGGPGDDALSVFQGDGGPGADTLSCSSEAPICSLTGGPGVDRLTGGPGNDFIDGGEGGGGDDDLLDGREGFDVLTYRAHPASVTVDLAGPSQRFASPGERDSIANFETVVGGPGDDLLSTPRNLVFPESLCCVTDIRGGRGDDRIVLRSPLPAYGGRGDDHITGRPGPLGSSGGPGDDRLTGSAGRDLLLGDRGSDVLLGLGGRDGLVGHSGSDELAGGRGDDRLLGGGGRDLLRGGPGNDELAGREDRSLGERRARDRLRCGAGRDRATADRRDRVTRCERVRRGKRPGQ